MGFDILVAYDDAAGIGKDGGIPWTHLLKQDLKWFRKMTDDSVVIMGSKTWTSLPKRPLPNRVNIVVSSNGDMIKEGGVRAISFDSAIEIAQTYDKKIYVIGGGTIYQQAVSMPMLDAIHVTHIHGTYDCDIFFPRLSGRWRRTLTTNTLEGFDRYILRREA